METIASVLRRLAPSKGDAGVVVVGTSIPFLAGAAPAGGDMQSLINMAIAAAASTAVGLIVKAGVAGAGAFIRAKARRMKNDANPNNDDAGEALEAVADKIDPEGARKNPAAPGPEVTQKIERGPQP